MNELIVAMDENGGIGYQGNLPWHIKEELDIFKEKTMNKTLIMGRKTLETLPLLLGRKIICVSRQPELYNTNWKNKPIQIVSQIYDIDHKYQDLMIAGGADIYCMAFSIPNFIQKIHLSIVKGTYDCDTFFIKDWLDDFVIEETVEYDKFIHHTMIRTKFGERQYLDLIKNILLKGEERIGRNGKTISIFKNDMTFDLRNGFPLLTTKKMFLRGILEEFLFFIRGNTDSTYLSNKNVKIWEGNTSEEFISKRGLPYAKGVLGPLYGYQWRFFNAEYHINDQGRPSDPHGGIDQLTNVINLIKNDPQSRRILLTAYNPAQAEAGVLYPCHSIIIQFYVQGEFLDMFCFNRSNDAFHGVPFNIASSALLLIVVAKLTNKIPRFFHMTMGDTHIYEDHIQQVRKQLQRIPYIFPNIEIPNIKNINDVENLQTDDFILSNYKCHQSIKAQMIV